MPLRQRAVSLVCAVFILAACVPRSEQPLSDTASARPDPRLLGTWIGKNADGDGPVWIHFAEGEKSMTEIVLVAPEPGKGADTSFYVMHPTLAGRYSYMNVRSFVPENLLSLKVADDLKYPKSEGYLLCRYEIAPDGILKIWILNDGIARKIEDGSLKGKVRKGEYTKEITLTETPDNLLRFFEKEDHGEFFELFLVCRKVDERLP